MKKPLKIALTSVGALAGVVVLTLATTSIVNVVATNVEAGRLHTYGQLVPVDGKKMNVSISGTGDDTVVLLPGFGTAAPALDFSPLVKELETTHKVVVVEPFGYGLSDKTDKPRTTANIVSEIHEAVASLDIDRYTLMGHSIAGIYGLDYVNKYPKEVTAFVGIDSSVPDQPGMDKKLPVGAMKAAKFFGVTRVVTELAGDPYAGFPYSADTKDQMKILSLRNTSSDTYSDEMSRIGSNFADAKGETFPKTTPVLLFAQADNKSVEGWLPLHEEQAASVDHGEVVKLDAEHYLHHTKSKEIAADYSAFMAKLPQTK
jgi:pimeloyl-ACP methyl ester carboxylesterase